ncbi:hypothetical protein BDF14DRAFT_1101534 [Spinellus fusiger]|nr:hypothetical protein BDF14DRAFT_1101534 [Spinellus fusiger]
MNMTETTQESNVALVSKYTLEKERLTSLLRYANILVGISQTKPQGSLEEQLSARMEELKTQESEKSSKIEDNGTPQSIFISECLRLLTSIQEVILSVVIEGESQISTNRDLLGVRDLRLIHTLLQVVVSWGLYPCFSSGVGVPLSQRVKSGYINHGK